MKRMSDQIHFLGIIPARFASSRFPGKPLALIENKPMVQHVYEQASIALETVYVATDHSKIFQVVNDFGGKAVMTSEKHQSGTDRCAEAVQLIEHESGHQFDVVINIQGDEPFLHPHQLELLKSCFLEDRAGIATLVSNVNDLMDPNRPKVVVNKYQEAIYFSRNAIPAIRGEDPSLWLQKHVYYMHIGLYGYRKNILLEITDLSPSALEQAESLEQLRWIENGYPVSVRITEQDSYSIDTPADLERLKKRFS